MKKFSLSEMFGYAGLFVMSVIWAASAWYVFITGGYYHTARYTKVVSYADGYGAMFVAFLFLSLSAISMAVIYKRLGLSNTAGIVTAALLFGSATLYLLLN